MSDALKPQYGWSVAALLPITPAVSRFFVTRGVSANAVSWLSFVVFLAGLVIYLTWPDYFAARLVAVVCFIVGTLLDVVDGYVARATKSTGLSGAYLDAGIDIARYNVFLLAVYIVAVNKMADLAVLLVYTLLLNVAFFRLFRQIGAGANRRQGNAELGRWLPVQYREFCINRRLLFNPLNLEDQLVLYLFVIGVMFGREVEMLWFCLSVRLIEIAMLFIARMMRTSHG
jgi:phosphatidylglycerophosphate synthase